MQQTHKIFVLILVFVLLATAFLFTRNKDQSNIFPTPSPAAQQLTVDSSDMTAEEIELRANGSTFTNQTGVFRFLYPIEFTLDMQNNGQFTRIYKRGAQLRPQSEMTDGIIIVFETIDLQGKTLSDWIDTAIAEEEGISEVVKPKQVVTLKDYTGFTYSMHGLGETEYLVFQKDDSSTFAISIAMVILDPQNKGYQTEVDTILNTLQILK